MKGQKHECRGKKFFALERRNENAKLRRGDICITVCKRSAAYGSRGNVYIAPCKPQALCRATNDRVNLTTNVIASAAKQPSLRARRSQSRAFAKTLMFFPDCFVATLLAMTRFCCLCGVSRFCLFHFHFSILEIHNT
jgi:hypothetical protein